MGHQIFFKSLTNSYVYNHQTLHPFSLPPTSKSVFIIMRRSSCLIHLRMGLWKRFEQYLLERLAKATLSVVALILCCYGIAGIRTSAQSLLGFMVSRRESTHIVHSSMLLALPPFSACVRIDSVLFLLGFRVAQIRTIFTLPTSFGVPEPLAYVELFTTPNTEEPIVNVGMYRIRRVMEADNRCGQVIPLSLIYRSVHLLPMFGRVPSVWTSDNVLEKCDTFYVNRYIDEHMFSLIFS
jgi:succinate dehydrogenase hydrophobic anchor subunit